MAPAALIEGWLEAGRHTRSLAGIRDVADRGASPAAGAGMLALPRAIGMALAHPPAVLAKGAFHSQNIAELVFGER